MRVRSKELLLALVVSASGCHKAPINQSGGSLAFTCPSSPSSLSVTDQGQEVTVDFGEVPIGAHAALEIDVTSLSGVGVTVNSAASQASSSFAFPLGNGTTVEPAPPTVVQATFAPTQAGSQSASWKIEIGSDSTITVTLQGHAFPVNLTVNPNPVDFGNVEIHAAPVISATVTNGSSAAIDLSLSVPDGGPFSIAPLSAQQEHLAAGAQVSLQITYAPPAVETDSSSFTVAGCAGCGAGNSAVQVPLQGAGVLSTFSFSNPLQFGFVAPKTSVQKILALKNIGGTPLQIDKQPDLYPGAFIPPNGQPAVYAFAAGAPAVNYPYTIAAGSELDLPIVFTPPQLGAFLDATVTVYSSDQAEPKAVIALQGYGGGAQINCQPTALNLGPVAVGFTGTATLLCLNAGTDVPGHPEAALQLSQVQLTVDNPDFAATLQGGSSVSLTAGESATIDVGFAPRDAGTELATLDVGSNDLAHDPLAVALTGQGVVPGPCNAVVQPPGGLQFGEVTAGSSALLQFAVTNRGDNYCIVQDVAMAPGSNPAFSLLNGNLGYALVSYPGNPNNPTNLPTSLRVPVQYAPTQSEASATGAVNFRIANAVPVAQSVPLAGSSAPGCLTFSPSPLNFGSVGFDSAAQDLCFKPHQLVTAQNNCSNAITVSGLAVDVNLDTTPQFALGGLPTLPLTVSPGAQFTFTATFEATQVGTAAETAQVTTNEFATPYSISLVGDAEIGGNRTDSFVVPKKQLDFILVLDVDDDQSDGLSQFAPQIPALIGEATSDQLDYQIAVVTDATCSAGDQGYFLPCDHCMVDSSPNNAVYVTPQSKPNPATALEQLVHAVWVATYPCGGSTDEQFFEVPYQSLASSLLSGHNSGFLRDSAYLGLLTINTDAEDDHTNLPATQTTNFLQNLKPDDPSLVSWSYVNSGLGKDPTAKVSVLASQTGGILVDMSVNSWESSLLQLFSSTIDLGVFHLGAQPSLSTLQVEVAGTPLPQTASSGNSNWSYDPVRNAVVLSAGILPTPGTDVTISYSISCN